MPFVGMAKFKFLAHFPVDHIAHPVVSRLVFYYYYYYYYYYTPGEFFTFLSGDFVLKSE